MYAAMIYLSAHVWPLAAPHCIPRDVTPTSARISVMKCWCPCGEQFQLTYGPWTPCRAQSLVSLSRELRCSVMIYDYPGYGQFLAECSIFNVALVPASCYAKY